ncbi:MAG: hypothetical protein V1837_02680 [Candidatus Woesearchaeota archaeon]
MGPEQIKNLSTVTAPVKSAYKLNTTGGTFTTLLINITSQTYRWKAYAGNITGKLSLDDNLNSTIYDWSIATVAGEVYATRSSTTITWQNIICANISTARAEEQALNISSSNDDSINRTFIKSALAHKEFYTATKKFASGSCPAIATYVNNTAQSGNFQEVLLYDSARIVYAGLLENKAKGFNNQYYDFQLIVPESGLEGSQPVTAYYFYVELT